MKEVKVVIESADVIEVIAVEAAVCCPDCDCECPPDCC
jgi:hypothetical protein